MTSKEPLTIQQVLQYETSSHWLSKYISFNWGQELIAMYIVNKTSRKHKRYLYFLKMKELTKPI